MIRGILTPPIPLNGKNWMNGFRMFPDFEMDVGQNPGTPGEPQVIAGLKWMFIPLKMVFS